MLSLSFSIDKAGLPALKSHLRGVVPELSSALRCEALARGIGFRTFASLQAALADGKILNPVVDGQAFYAFANSRSSEVKTSQIYVAVSRFVIANLLKRHDRMFAHGFGFGPPERTTSGKRESPSELYARVTASRADCLDPTFCMEFLRAVALLSKVSKTKTIRPSGSYWVKHIAENLNCTFPDGELLGPDYVSNGALIFAALHLGFRYRTHLQAGGYDAPNLTFNMSKKQLVDLDIEVSPNGAYAQDRRAKEVLKSEPRYVRDMVRSLRGAQCVT